MVSRRMAIAGGAGGLVLAALGYRAWDRGVFSGASGEAYDPWEEWRGFERDGSRRPLRAAILAASPHNTQPWRFEVAGDAITVYADRSRHLGTFDPFRREMQLGLGAAIENLVLAANAIGYTANVRATEGKLGPSPGPQPVPVAEVEFTPAPAAHGTLFDAIPQRHTNRGPYLVDHPVPPERFGNFVNGAKDGDRVRVAFITDPGAHRELGALIVQATEHIIADPQMSADSFHWIRTGARDVNANRDGIVIDDSGVSPFAVIAGKMAPDLDREATDKVWLDLTRDTHVATAPVLGMLLVRDRLDMTDAIAAGRAWQRLHLALTADGIAAQPMNQPVEMVDRHAMLGKQDTLAAALAKFANAPDWQATFVFRLGHAESPASPSPRRPFEDVVRS